MAILTRLKEISTPFRGTSITFWENSMLPSGTRTILLAKKIFSKHLQTVFKEREIQSMGTLIP